MKLYESLIERLRGKWVPVEKLKSLARSPAAVMTALKRIKARERLSARCSHCGLSGSVRVREYVAECRTCRLNRSEVTYDE